MQNRYRQGEIFKATARQCKADPNRSCSLIEHIRFSLLVQARHALTQHNYTLARELGELVQVARRSNSVQEAWQYISFEHANGTEYDRNTPDCNTGVADTAEGVPLDYFVRDNL